MPKDPLTQHGGRVLDDQSASTEINTKMEPVSSCSLHAITLKNTNTTPSCLPDCRSRLLGFSPPMNTISKSKSLSMWDFPVNTSEAQPVASVLDPIRFTETDSSSDTANASENGNSVSSTVLSVPEEPSGPISTSLGSSVLGPIPCTNSDFGSSRTCPSGSTKSTASTPFFAFEKPSAPISTSPRSRPDTFRKVFKPRFPIRVSDEGPQPFCLEAQKRVMRWRNSWYSHTYTCWIIEPDINVIGDIVRSTLKRIGVGGDHVTIELMAEGGFNKVYSITSKVKETGVTTLYVLRVALPVDPYYKTECDVATTELVRHFTSIPVPIIYAYDSSSNNRLGLEWMLMEKITAKELDGYWLDLDNDNHIRLVRQVAGWMDELSRIQTDKIGGLYLRWTDTDMEFYIGRIVHMLFYQSRRLLYSINRGPFVTLEDFYDAILDVQQQELNDSYNHKIELIEPEDSGATRVSDEALIYLEADREDEEARANFGFSDKLIRLMNPACDALRKALPVICSPEIYPLSTMLTHNDLSTYNVLVSEDGAPFVIIDWENIFFQPVHFILPFPFMMRSKDREETQLWDDNPNSWACFFDDLSDIIRTKLRPFYKEELEKLQSPLLPVFDDRENSFVWDLFQKVVDTRTHMSSIPDWVEYQLEDSDGGEDEDEDEDDECPKEDSVLEKPSVPTSPALRSRPDTLRKIPRPRFPIRFSDERPQPFSLETQKRIMRWRHSWIRVPRPDWMIEPDFEVIKDTIRPVLHMLGADGDNFKVENLTDGAHNKIYTITTVKKDTGIQIDYVLRLALPVYPYYKTECDVATTEFVRHFTGIPVPIIYAYDSSSKNALGLEWMLMEKVMASPLREVWVDLHPDVHHRIAVQIAEWCDELSRFQSDKIGSLYLRWTEAELEFFVGRPVDLEFYIGRRLLYSINRGPFDSLIDYYDAVLDVQQQELDDPYNKPPLDADRLKLEAKKKERRKLEANCGDKETLEECFWAKADREDEEDDLSFGVRCLDEWEYDRVVRSINTLRHALPTIWPPETREDLTTMLNHPDISWNNILSDANGTPVALLDWENVHLKPMIKFCEPFPVLVSSADKLKTSELHGGRVDTYAPDNVEGLADSKDEAIRTTLCSVYRKRLEELESPLLAAFEERSFELDLYVKVMDPAGEMNHILDWVEALLAEEADYVADKVAGSNGKCYGDSEGGNAVGEDGKLDDSGHEAGLDELDNND
ncbi:hypothetical protein MMC24_006127 [Lignoscripta atroalba]|nr:hypothetical protein [Lignoscripta atroalba]